jgi:non-homologous end joining protein Ku
MVSRAIWDGTISFGLVQIPVGLHPAESHDSLDFTQLDRRDLAPVGYRRYNRETEKDVEWADIVKGYEYSDGKHLEIPAGTLKSAHIAPGELAMAQRLVSDMESDFTPKAFKDSYHDDLLAFIKKKVKAGDVAEIDDPEADSPEPTNVVDIMSLLRRSLGDKKSDSKPTRRKAASKTATAKRAPRKPAKKRSAAKKPARHPTRKAA